VTIKDCYPVLVPVDSTPGSGSTNMELAQMLVNVSGFCAGGLNARSDITPGGENAALSCYSEEFDNEKYF
jgi:hypothetical protein